MTHEDFLSEYQNGSLDDCVMLGLSYFINPTVKYNTKF